MQEAKKFQKNSQQGKDVRSKKNTQKKNGFQWILQLNNPCENVFNHNSASQVVLRNVSNDFKSEEKQIAPTGYAQLSF